jgi:hypothetical protein
MIAASSSPLIERQISNARGVSAGDTTVAITLVARTEALGLHNRQGKFVRSH